MPFQISPLPVSRFEHLFHLPPDALASLRARRIVATNKPGFPCRVSLASAEIGEEVILVHYEHQPADTPFRSSHAVYVRPGAAACNLEGNEVPEILRAGILSLRAFDASGMMVIADLADGKELESAIESIFQDASVSYIHVHFAKPGCYAARVDRASC